MKGELKPCPFCGGGPRLYPPTCNRLTPYDPSHRAFPVVRCSCGAEIAGIDWEESGKSAIAKWNRRALEQREAVQGAGIDAEAKRLFEATTAGWINVTAWEELHPSTREMYVAHALRRLATQPRDVPEGFVPVPRDALLEVLRISDREHDAWQAVKAAIAAAPSGEG